MSTIYLERKIPHSSNGLSTSGIQLSRPFKRPVLQTEFLEDSPRDFINPGRTLTARSTVCDISRLHNNEDVCGSETVVSFDSMSTKSEAAYVPVPLEEAQVSRRGSCPSIVSGTVSRLSSHPPSPVRRVLSVGQLDDHNTSRLTAIERRERIKQSLSRISQSVASAAKSLSTSRHEPTAPVVPPNEPETEILSDILSPVSKVNETHLEEIPPQTFGTLRIHPLSLPLGKPPLAPSTSLNPGSRFIPSESGKSLMQIYDKDAPQERMWSGLLEKSKCLTDYADAAGKMPSMIYCLRGLVRFGTGDYGCTRTDVLTLLVNILTRRHAISDSTCFLEAVDCSAALISMLAINPVSRQTDFTLLEPRSKFLPILTSQNGFLLQQTVLVLSMHVPRYVSMESQKDTCLPLMTRTISTLLEVVFIYTSCPTLCDSWIHAAPVMFKQTLVQTLAGIANRLTSLLFRCVLILDILLDHLTLDSGTCRLIAQQLKTAITRNACNQTAQVISRWGASVGRKSRSGSISNFFKSMSKPPKQSTKTSIYTEYTHLP